MECPEVGNSFLCDRRINKAHHNREVLIFQCTKSIIWNHSPYSYMTSDLLVQVLTYKIWWVSWQSIQLKKDNKGENNYTCCLNTYSNKPPPPPKQKELNIYIYIHDLVDFIFYRENTFWKKEKRWWIEVGHTTSPIIAQALFSIHRMPCK